MPKLHSSPKPAADDFIREVGPSSAKITGARVARAVLAIYQSWPIMLHLEILLNSSPNLKTNDKTKVKS